MLKLAIASPDFERPVSPEAARGSVHVWEEQGHVCSYAYSAAGQNWIHVPGVASFRFRPGQDTVVAIPIDSTAQNSVREAFERHVLPMALQALGRELLHASAVLMPQGVVAFSGNSGAGKSTLAHLMTLRGHSAWADDAVMFERAAGDEVRATLVPFRINLRADSASFFGLSPEERLAAGSTAGHSERLAGVIFLARRHDGGPEITVRRLTSTEAFEALLRQAYCFSPNDEDRNGRTAAEFLELAARVPIHEIAFASGFQHLDRLAERIEEIVCG